MSERRRLTSIRVSEQDDRNAEAIVKAGAAGDMSEAIRVALAVTAALLRPDFAKSVATLRRSLTGKRRD